MRQNLKLDVRKLQAVASSYLPFLKGLNQHEAESAVRFKAHIEPPNDWLRMEKKGTDAEIMVFGDIGLNWWTGEGITPTTIQDQINELKPFNSLKIRINSGGGDVFDGFAIHNIFRSQGVEVTTEIEGIAGSIASVIAQAASPGKLRIHQLAQVMVHNSMSVMLMFDNANAIEREAAALVAVLRKIDNQVAGLYASRSSRPIDEWAEMMNRETWMTGEEAVSEKFADEMIGLKQGEAKPDKKKSDGRLKIRDLELRLRSA